MKAGEVGDGDGGTTQGADSGAIPRGMTISSAPSPCRSPHTKRARATNGSPRKFATSSTRPSGSSSRRAGGRSPSPGPPENFPASSWLPIPRRVSPTWSCPIRSGSRIEEIILQQRQRDLLRSHGLTPKRKLLLVGPPGCGKTMTASVLAAECRLPLLFVQLHSLISKYMGETAAKLHHVFDAMGETRGVYLFDEFDAIGATRSAGNDVGEIRRVLNSFLQFLESATTPRASSSRPRTSWTCWTSPVPSLRRRDHLRTARRRAGPRTHRKSADHFRPERDRMGRCHHRGSRAESCRGGAGLRRCRPNRRPLRREGDSDYETWLRVLSNRDGMRTTQAKEEIDRNERSASPPARRASRRRPPTPMPAAAPQGVTFDLPATKPAGPCEGRQDRPRSGRCRGEAAAGRRTRPHTRNSSNGSRKGSCSRFESEPNHPTQPRRPRASAAASTSSA